MRGVEPWRASGPRLGVPLSLAIALASSGCATSGVGPGTSLADARVVGQRTAVEHALDRFGLDLQAAMNSEPQEPKKSLKALRSGLALLDLQCGRYIDAVGSANQAATNERRQVSLVGGFASAIMGLVGNTAKEVAGVATAFSFAGSSMESYTTAYLFSDAASSVTKIVREAQQAWLAGVDTPENLANLDSADVVRLLVDYERLCRPAQIRALIDQSIAKGTVVADRGRSSDADVVAVLQSLQAILGVPVTEAEAVVLYAWSRNPAQREAGAKLSELAPVKSLMAKWKPAELDRLLAQAFLSVSLAGSRVPERWSAAVKSMLAPAPTTAGEEGSDPQGAPPAPGRVPLVNVPATPPTGLRPAVPVLSIR